MNEPKYPEAGRLLDEFVRKACPAGASLTKIADHIDAILPARDKPLAHTTVSAWFQGKVKPPPSRLNALGRLFEDNLDPHIERSRDLIEALMQLYELGDRHARGLPPRDRPLNQIAQRYLRIDSSSGDGSIVSAELAAAAEGFSKAALPRRIEHIQEGTSGPRDDRDPLRRIAEHEAWRESAHASYGWDRFERIPIDPDQVLSQLSGRTSSNATFALVLGEPGAGKTTLLETWVAKRLTGSAGKSPEIAFIRLEQLTLDDVEELCGKGNTTAVAAALAGATDIPGVGQLPEPPSDRPILWVLDALDELRQEISGAKLAGKLLGRLARLPGQVMISCRSAIWQGLPSEWTRYADRVHRYQILPLDRPQQIAVLTRPAVRGDRPAWSPERATDLVERIHRNVQMREIAGNALLLGLIAEVDELPWEHATPSLPASRASFFRQAVAARWAKDTMAESLRDRLPTARKILMRFAGTLELRELSGTLDQLQAAIDAEATGIPTPEWHTAFRNAGLLSIRYDTVRFDHLTFQEYFLACWFLEEGRTIGGLLDQLWMSPRYEETLAMAIGIAAVSNVVTVDDALNEFVQGWLDHHKHNPHKLWNHENTLGLLEPRSPMYVTLNVIVRSGAFDRTPTLLARTIDKYRPSFEAAGLLSPADRIHSAHAVFALAAHRESKLVSAVLPMLTPEELACLAENDDAEIRLLVALHPSSSAETLLRLADDEDIQVRYCLAGTPSTRTDTLAVLAWDETDTIRHAAASHPGVLLEDLIVWRSREEVLAAVHGNEQLASK